MKVCFLYNSQLHQVPHSLPIALELAARHADAEVVVAGADERHLEFARRLAARYDAKAAERVRWHLLDRPWDVRLRAWLTAELAPAKKRTLEANAGYFAGFDALVTPELTSAHLRRRKLLPNTRMVCTGHGAGDRAITVSPVIGDFDFVFARGAKLERRMLTLGLIRPGAYATGVYAKFDWVRAAHASSPRLFDNGRPTVLYNPHYSRHLSSWHEMGWRVLDYFAASDRYNCVFAPHVRLFEPPRAAKYRAFRRYLGLPHMRIDLGSERSIDMSYTLGADVYLGDVSSQLAEFLWKPRPCLFLDPRHVAWRGDANYRAWTLGPVLGDVSALDDALGQALATHADFEPLQRAYLEETFGDAGRGDEPSARRGADILAAYLRRPR